MSPRRESRSGGRRRARARGASIRQAQETSASALRERREASHELEEAVAEVEALGRCGDDDDGELAEWDAPTSPTVVA